MMRFIYGMKARGFSPWRQPMNGFLEKLNKPEGCEYYDLLAYNRRLTAEELDEYELEYTGSYDLEDAIRKVFGAR